MKVYVTKGGYDYEGFNILGIYSERDKAQSRADEMEDRYDYTEVTEYDVQ